MCNPGRDALLVRCQKGQNKGTVSKARARITSHSSGLRYAQPLNSSVMLDVMKYKISILTIVSTIIVILFLLYVGLLFVCEKLNDQSELMASKYVALINAFRSKNNRYPIEVDELDKPASLGGDQFFLLLPPKIKYSRVGSHYWLYYIEYPLGPKRVYTSQTNEWSYEE